MNLLALTGFFCFTTSIILGVFVYLRNPAKLQNRAYFGLSFSVSLYGLAYFLWQLSKDVIAATFYFRILVVAIIIINIFYLLYVFVFTGLSKVKIIFLLVNIFTSYLFIHLNFKSQLYNPLIPKYNSGFWPVANIYTSVYILFWHFQALYGIYCLIQAFKVSNELKKQQIKYFAIAAAIGYLGGSSNWPMWYGKMSALPYSNILITVYVGIVAYTIIKYRLLDIEVIIRRAAVFAGLLASVFAILILPTLLIQEYILRSAGFRARAIGLTISGIIIIFTMRRIEDLLIRLTDKFLFQKKYDYRDLLKTFSTEVLTVLDLSKLVNLTVDSLSKIIRLESCAVLIYDKEKDNYPVFASLGLKEQNLVFDKTTHLINYLFKTHHYLLKDKTIAGLPDVGTVKEDLKKLNAELVVPVVLHDNLMGALVLGRKKSGEDFTPDDLAILLPLSQTLAVAISNAQLFVELVQSESRSEKMKAVATLAAGMAHEIKNPLTAIKTYAAFMPKYWTDKEFIDKFNRIVPESVNRIDRIVKDLLAFSRPTPPEFKEIKITDVVSHTLEYVSNDLVRNNINYNFDFKDNDAVIQADPNQLTQVLLNLFLNAIEAMPQGGMLTVSSKLVGETGTPFKGDGDTFHEMGTPFKIQSGFQEKSVPNLPSTIQIRIQDTGCGIAPEHLSRIFDPFFTTKDKGTGLGLSIVKEIVNNHHGKIKVESELGKGTVFILEFPVVA